MQIPNPNHRSANLGSIRGPNPLLGSAICFPPQPSLILSIDVLMEIKRQMGLIGKKHT